MPRTTHQPLPANSPKLRDRRYEASAHGPKNERGGYPALGEEARFTRLAHAKAWADEQYPDAYLIAVDYMAAITGWRCERAATRREGTWE